MCSLYAFINLSLCNDKLKTYINKYSSITSSLVELLSVKSYEIRRNVTFCISNIIEKYEDYGKEIFKLSVMSKLIRNINDDPEDELSTKV